MEPNEKPKAYTAWVIERTDLGYPLYWDGSQFFTDNIENVVKFRFKEDADKVRKIICKQWGDSRLESRCHQWGFTDELEGDCTVLKDLIYEAYVHLDTYGVVYEENDSRRKIQQDLFDKMREALKGWKK